MMVTEKVIELFISKGDVFANDIYTKTKQYIPLVARLCLLSGFIEYHFLLPSYWAVVISGMYYSSSDSVAMYIHLLRFILNTTGCVLILLQRRTKLACGLICASYVAQSVLAISLGDFIITLTNGSILGSLVMLAAESTGEAKTIFADIPTLDENKPKNYLKLGGRCLLVLMFLNFISWQQSFFLILHDILACVLMLLVVLGFKTKLSVLVLIVYLNIINFYENQWWNMPETETGGYHRLFVQHKFLRGISVTGGLLMLLLHGPGDISLDEAKKKW